MRMLKQKTITMQQQPKKKQNYLHPFTGIRNQNNHDLSQAEPRYKTPS